MLKTDWTPDEMPPLDGKHVVVTGANSGIGFEATREFARRGAQVVMACRSLERGREARRAIERAFETVDLELMELNLADLESIRAFASSYQSTRDSLDVLVNNAGVMALPYQTTEDGFEMQFGVNHLGHFALTGRLLDPLLRSDFSRVVTVSSGAHRFGEIQFNDLNWRERSYSKWGAYGQSKLANLLFAFELQRRLERADAPTISLACHPGYASTDLQRKGPEQEGSKLKQLVVEWANSLIAQSAREGAWPTLCAATNPDLEGGEYVGPGGLMEMWGSPTLVEPASKARDREVAERLWRTSRDMTEVDYELPAPDEA